MNNSKILRTLILAFGLVTALVHLWLVYSGLTRPRNPGVSYQFLANGVGYLLLLGAFLLTLTSQVQWNRIVQYLLVAFTAGSIVAWFVVNQGRFLLPLSIFDKTIEALLIIALWLHLRVTRPDHMHDQAPASGGA